MLTLHGVWGHYMCVSYRYFLEGFEAICWLHCPTRGGCAWAFFVIEQCSRTYLPNWHEYLYASICRIGSCIYSEFVVLIAQVLCSQAVRYYWIND